MACCNCGRHALLIACVVGVSGVSAQTYPVRPVRIVVPAAPGGGVDTNARLVGQKLSDSLGQPVTIDNRPGAGGSLGTEIVARAAPDGYTLVMASPGHAITPSLFKLAFDPVKDFAPITLILTVPYIVVVHPSLPVRSMNELIALAKKRPKELLWSSSGNGSAQHLALELLQMTAGVQFTHVPYKGTGPGMTDLIAGRVAATSASVIATMPHVKAGRLRALAVAGRSRSQAVPDLPTVAEAGVPGFEIDVWQGLMAPAGTPPAVITRLHAEISRVLADPGTKQRMLELGFDPKGDPPDVFARYVAAEVQRWAIIIKKANIQAS